MVSLRERGIGIFHSGLLRGVMEEPSGVTTSMYFVLFFLCLRV